MALTYGEVRQRREEVDILLRKSITDHKVLAEKVGCSIQTIKDDIRYKRKKNLEHINALKNDGYIHSTSLAISQIQDIIEELQEMRTNEKLNNIEHFKIKLQLNVTIAELTSQVWAMEGDGIKLTSLIQEDIEEELIPVPQEPENITNESTHDDTSESDDITNDKLDDNINDIPVISSADEYDESRYDEYEENYESSQ